MNGCYLWHGDCLSASAALSLSLSHHSAGNHTREGCQYYISHITVRIWYRCLMFGTLRRFIFTCFDANIPEKNHFLHLHFVFSNKKHLNIYWKSKICLKEFYLSHILFVYTHTYIHTWYTWWSYMPMRWEILLKKKKMFWI